MTQYSEEQLMVAVVQAREDARDRAATIAEMCNRAGCAETAHEFIRSNVTISEMREKLKHGAANSNTAQTRRRNIDAEIEEAVQARFRAQSPPAASPHAPDASAIAARAGR